MIRVGIVGLGNMGRTHYQCYELLSDARVVAVADHNPAKAAGDLSDTWGNLKEQEGRVRQLPMDRIKGTTVYRELLASPDVDVVDICVPTPLHEEVALAALAAGKHVLCEKPLALDVASGQRIAEAARRSRGLFMPAMLMRFWPEWAWLKDAVVDNRFGRVLAATFRRVGDMPPGWFRDGAASGGAILDLHVHDTDFVYYLFGRPDAVFSRGCVHGSGCVGHVVTHYVYSDVPLVVAEGGWTMAAGFAFLMRYTVNFERATADFDATRSVPLLLYSDGNVEPVACANESPYAAELRYFLDCVANQRPPRRVTVDDAVASLRIIEAERRSIVSGRVEPL